MRNTVKDSQNEVNSYFKQDGIGWKLENGVIEYRGEEQFEKRINEVEAVLDAAELQTAETEIKEAIRDLSRRIDPDITGAIQHSLACLECVSREISGDKKATLGELIKKSPGIIPRPLDQAIEKIWGFASENGRHLREGQTPNVDEAELLVGVIAAMAIYLVKKLPHKGVEKEEDLPF